MAEGNTFLSFENFKKYPDIRCHFLEYYAVVSAIKRARGPFNSDLKEAVKFIIEQEKSLEPFIPLF